MFFKFIALQNVSRYTEGEKMKKAVYQSLFSVVVRTKVPGATVLNLVPAQDVPDGNGGLHHVESHYHNGLRCADKSFLNRHFFGIDLADDSGKKVVAEVEVVRKTLDNGKTFILLNVTKLDERANEPLGVLKFYQDPAEGFKVENGTDVLDVPFAGLLRVTQG